MKRTGTHWCKHYRAPFNNETCKAGVSFDSVQDRSVRPFRRPCTDTDAATSCASLVRPTPEEIEAEDRALAKRFGKIATARAAIVASKLTRGTIDCPACKEPQALRFSVASINGHIHASCKTADCVRWME